MLSTNLTTNRPARYVFGCR